MNERLAHADKGVRLHNVKTMGSEPRDGHSVYDSKSDCGLRVALLTPEMAVSFARFWKPCPKCEAKR